MQAVTAAPRFAARVYVSPDLESHLFRKWQDPEADEDISKFMTQMRGFVEQVKSRYPGDYPVVRITAVNEQDGVRCEVKDSGKSPARSYLFGDNNQMWTWKPQRFFNTLLKSIEEWRADHPGNATTPPAITAPQLFKPVLAVSGLRTTVTPMGNPDTRPAIPASPPLFQPSIVVNGMRLKVPSGKKNPFGND